MDLLQIEQMLINQGQSLMTIKAKLNNGMTTDLVEIKDAMKELSKSFQAYKDGREETCLYRRDVKSGRAERRARIAVFAAIGAIFLNAVGLIVTKILA